MGKYRKIDVRIWNDKKFRALSDNAKLVFLLVLTHPDTNQLGMIRTRPIALAVELGWQADAMQDAISTLSRMGMLMVDEMAGLIVAPNFLKYNPPNGPNSVKSWDGLIDLLPECHLRSLALIRVKAFVDGLSQAMRDAVPDSIKDAIADAIRDVNETPSGIQEQEQEQEQEQDIGRGPTSGTPPATVKPEKPAAKRKTRLPDNWFLPKEWGDWALEQGLTESEIRTEAECFADHWRSKGETHADWQATWRNWIRRSKTFSRSKVPRRETISERNARIEREIFGKTLDDDGRTIDMETQA